MPVPQRNSLQQDGISKLHAALQADGLVKGDENSFRQRITSSEDNCRQLYDALRSDGLVQGDYNSFKQHLGVTYSETPSGVSGVSGVSGGSGVSGSSGGAGTEGIQSGRSIQSDRSARNARSSRNAGGGVSSRQLRREFPSTEVEFPVTAAEAAARAAEVGASGGNAGRTGVTGGSGKTGVSGNSGNTGNIGSTESAGSAGGAVDTGVQDGRAVVVNKRYGITFSNSDNTADWTHDMEVFAEQQPKSKDLQVLKDIAKRGDPFKFRKAVEALMENTTDANVLYELEDMGFFQRGEHEGRSLREIIDTRELIRQSITPERRAELLGGSNGVAVSESVAQAAGNGGGAARQIAERTATRGQEQDFAQRRPAEAAAQDRQYEERQQERRAQWRQEQADVRNRYALEGVHIDADDVSESSFNVLPTHDELLFSSLGGNGSASGSEVGGNGQPPITNFGEAFGQRVKGMYRGFMSWLGDSVDSLQHTQEEAGRAEAVINKLLSMGIDPAKLAAQAMQHDPGVTWSQQALDDVRKILPLDADEDIFFNIIVPYYRGVNGTVRSTDEVRGTIRERQEQTTWGDEQRAALHQHKENERETEGVAAWLGDLAGNTVGTMGTMVISAVTGNPYVAGVTGAANLIYMGGSVMGESTYEARKAGYSNVYGRSVGAVDAAVEIGTEYIPFARYTGRLVNSTSSAFTRAFREAVRKGDNRLINQMEILLKRADNSVGGRLLSGRNAREFIGDVLAETGGEFTAEVVQSITPILYQDESEFPDMEAVLSQGLQGALGGLVMGGFFGGISNTVSHYQQRGRRKKQGYVDLARVVNEDGSEVYGEIIGLGKGRDTFMVYSDGETVEVPRKNIGEAYRYSFDEFERGSIEFDTEAAFNRGFSNVGPRSLSEAYQEVEKARLQLHEELGDRAQEVENWLIANPSEGLVSMSESGEYSGADMIVAQSFSNALSTSKGMEARIREDAAAELGKDADENGNLRYATLTDGRGRVAVTSSRETEQGGMTLTVRSLETGEVMMISERDIEAYETESPISVKDVADAQAEAVIARERKIADERISQDAEDAAELARASATVEEEANDGFVVKGQEASETQDELLGRSLTEDEADELILESTSRAIAIPHIDATAENWASEFPNGIVETPIGVVKLGENQYAKIIENNRGAQMGMIRPTLIDPDFIIEQQSQSSTGETERESSYLFVKAFTDEQGKKQYFFESVTIKKDGTEINISNHLERPKRVRKALNSGTLLYRKNGGAQTEQPSAAVSVATPQEVISEPSASKGSEVAGNEQGNGGESAASGAPEVLAFENGDVYEGLLDDDGRVHRVEVLQEVPDTDGALVYALFDGESVPRIVEKKTLQAWRDNGAEVGVAGAGVSQGNVQTQSARRVAGAPADYTADMELTVRDEDGSEKPAMVKGRVRYENGSFVPDANGNIIEYSMDGEVKHDHEDKLTSKVVSHVAPQQPEAETTPTTTEPQAPQTDEERVIREGIAGVGEGLRNAVNEQVASVRENDINNWLQKPTVADAMRRYGEGAQSVEEVVQRALADNPNEEIKAVLGDIMRFDSSKQLVQGYISQPQPAQPAEAPAQSTEQPTAEPMPVREVRTGKNTETEPDWMAVTPERGHDWLFGESGLDRADANEIVKNNLEEAQNAVKKASKLKPKKTTNPFTMQAERERIAGEQEAAQNALDYWKTVQSRQTALRNAELEQSRAEQAERDRIAHEQAVAEAQAEYEARKQAEAERKAVGNENPMPAITEKWNNATKVDGHRDEIMLPDGTPLKGHYVLHESGASSPSHNPETWQKTDGFPMDANDNSVNDRDYERDHDAQEHTQSIARQYDQRALQSVPVVSNDGVVLSGNGRTMAGELAARDNTDGAYVNYLKEYAPKFGFTAEQVGAMQHPRVSFVPDEAMPYTSETFAKFNQQEMKSQNKTEQAVKLGKTVSDDSFKGIVRTINAYDTLGDFYNDAQASLGAVYDLHNAGVVPQAQLAEMVDGVRGQEKLSAVGREFLENMLIGKAFESDPEVVRMLTAEPAMRQAVITALGEIVDNIALGGDWSLQGELADAVKLCFDARQGGAKYGEIVSTYARQGVLFADPDELQTVADFNNATMLMLADVLNDKRVTLLKTTLQLYNNNARQSASGQTDLFAGGIQSREGILRDVITFINENYGKRKEIEAARAAAVERRKAESVQQDGTPAAVSGGSADTGRSERSEEEIARLTHDEAITLIAQMEERADVAPDVELTIENWDAQFGEDGRVNTPIGEVKMGENQFTKLMRQGREGKLGMVKPTLETPDVIIEDASEAKEDDVAERNSSYVFVKAFKKADGSRFYYFTSVTVSKDGKEVVISNHEKRKNAVANLLTKGKLVWKHADDVSAASDVEQGFFSSQGNMSDPTTEGTDAPQTNDVSEVFTRPALEPDTNTDTSGVDSGQAKGVTTPAGNSPQTSAGKGSEISTTAQEKGEKVAENQTPNAVQAALAAAEQETNTEPTEAEKEAGNYKKGHVKIDGYDVTIENPKGSVRRGTDASGKQWEQEMQNTYGYIRGTEGVDGDHIDVFFSEDPSQGEVFVVDQVNKDGSFDEHKVMYGFPDIESARKAYLSNYEDGWQGLGAITPVSKEEFKKWIRSSHRKTKPFAEYSSVKTLGDVQLGEQTTASYSIEPTTYTNKKGKTTPMHLVTFGRELSKEEIRAGKELAKESRGWWDREKGGFMMRSEEAAKQLAEALSNEEAVQDAQPLSVEDVATATDQADMKAASETIKVEQEPQTTPQYDFDREDDVYDKTLTGLRNVLNDRKRGAIPNIKSIENVIRDLRKRAKTIEDGMATAAGETIPQAFDALANLNGKRRAYEQFLVDIRKKMAETERDDALAAHGVKLGDKIMYKGKEATIHDADARQVTLDVGLAPVLYEVTDWENVEVPKREPATPQPKKVNVESLMGELGRKGEAKLSDHTEEQQQEESTEQPKQEEKKTKSKWVDDADAERFEELRRRLRMKLGGQLNMGLDPEAFAIGVEMSYLMLKHGARKFGEFAKNLIEALGEGIRPYVKTLYNGARDLPEMAEYEKDMTPWDEVRSFDVMNFDKEGAKDIVATAEHIVREQSAEREAKEATDKLKQERNEQRKETEQEVAANTEALASEAATVASEVESKLPSARSEREVNDLAKSIDDAIDKVNDQLALLGYYEAEPVESDFNEAYGYMRNAEKKAVKNVTELFKTLTKELGISDPVVYDTKGKKQKSVTANIAPAGGDVTMRFMLNRDKGVELYIDFMLEPDYENNRDNLVLKDIMFRPERNLPNGGRDYLRANNFFPVDVTMPQMLQGIRSVCQEWLPAEDYVAMAQRIAAKNAGNQQEKPSKERKSKKKSVSLQEQTIPDLFSGLFSEEDNLKNESNDTAKTRQAENRGREDGTVGRVPADRDRVLDTNGTEQTDNGRTASVSDTSGSVVDATRTGIPGQRSSRSATRGNNVAGETERGLSDGGRSLRNGETSSERRTDDRGTSAETGSIPSRAGEAGGGKRGLAQLRGRGNVKQSKQPEPKFKRNYLYPENSSEIDNMTPQQRLTANVEALEVVRTLMKEGREATPEEREILGKYRGWGGVELGRAYSTDMMRRSFTDRWGTPTEQGKLLGRLADVIDELDPNGERGVLSAINRAALTSYYTPTGIARAMNRFAELAGFKGGTMLDPSMGNGVFEGTMSKAVQQRTMIHGVELDWLTGQIARNLYPDANVLVTGYEQAGAADNAYDVVISNIPFGDISVTDKSWKHDSSPVRRAAQNRIHNYFAVKMLDNTRPGGLCVIMTSNAILDTKGNQIIREHLADQAEILGVVRLPDNTFKGAGTSVVTDVIFLRKYKDDADRAAKRNDENYTSKIEKPFLSSSEMELVNPTDGKTYKVALNGYFTANKGMMIGDAKAGGQYRADQFGLGSNMSTDELAAAMQKLVEKKIVGDRKGKLFDTHKTEREVHQAVSEAYKGDGNFISSGNIVEQDGMFGIVTSNKNKYGDVTSTFNEMPSLKAKASRIRAMLPIREAMKELIAAEIGGTKEDVLKELRKKLHGAYDAYVKKFGHLNNKENDFLTEDIDGYTLRSLEKMKDGKFAGLSDIFTKNTIKPALDLSTAKTPQDAISLSLAEYGEINPSFMEDALGKSWAEQCGETLFRTPFTEDVYETADAYLSGDVKTKLEQAREAAKQDKTFDHNVKALEAVQPKDIPFEDISIRMGARWVPTEVYTDFMYDMFGIRKDDWKGNKSGVEYMPEVDQYVVNVAKNELGGEADAWRTSRRAASEVFTAALQDKSLSVFDTIKENGKEIKVLNKEETELLNNKIQDLRTAFEDWLSQNPEREEMLMRLYNDKFNRTVLRKFDGSHLNVAGLMGKELRPHQKDAVWMLINNRGGIVDHIVGAGKTLVMQSAIMEMRRMGIAKKPMIIGLKATVAQIAKEFREAYPAARILAPTEKDFAKENRKKFMSQIALNDYDCVILSHDQYCMLPHTEEVERGVIDEQMMQLDAAIEYLYGQSDKSQLTKKQIKGLEKRKANLEAKLDKLLDRKIDREFTFEGLGVDYLFVDECQHFKSLPYVSTYDRVAGLGDKQGSQRAIALLNGVRYLQRMHQGDRGTVFLSGTTISNSLSEIYHLLNYLRPSEMERLGMTTFDAWAGNYAIHTAELEYGVTNELKEKDRFRSLTNIPELSKMYAEIADVRNDMNLKLPKPKMRSHIITVPQSDLMREINAEIVNMVRNKDGHYFGIDSKDTTPWGLLASTLSAKAAINPRLIDEAYDSEGGKIPAVCEDVKKIYDQFAGQKGTQLIFCDTGVPGKGKKYDAYSDIINRLVNDYGIPRKEIADIHEAGTDEKRKALFAKVNDGSVRILIGGTKNMGTGVNVQKRIVAMHHVDVPWTPADREQREGRGVRQGNEIARDFNDDNVDVYFYATEGSLDMYKYQLQETKGKLFAQFKSGTIGERTFDEGDAEGDFDPAEVVAMLSGNPVIFEKSKQDKKVEKLRRAKRAYESDWQRRRSRFEELQTKQRNFERLISLNSSDVRELERGGFIPDNEGKYPTAVTVQVKDDYSSRRTFDKPKEAGEYLHSLLKQGKKVELSGFGQKANVTVPITEAGLFGKPVAELDSYGGIKYTVDISDDDTAAGVAFRNLLQKVYSNRKVYERNLEDVNNQLKGADPGENKFPKQAELDEALAEKKRLDDEYKKLSDEKPKADEDTARYRIREDEPPTKTGIGYKVFVLKDGKLYPPMVANPNGEATPVGVWLDADAAPVAGVTKTGRQQVKAGGKGTQGGSGKLAYRPGWHLGEIPYALQFNRMNPETGQRELFPANFVWAEVEYANDVDYNEEARSYGMNANGKYQHSLAGLPRVPVNGAYKYRTNPDPNTDPWVITGAMKVNRILKPSEVDAMVEAAGREPQQRQADAITDEQVDALNREVQRTMKSDRDMMRTTAEQMGEKLHTDINIIEDVNEITHPNAEIEANRRKAKGWYDKVTRQVYVVLPNNRDIDDAKATVAHEVIGHKGLRELVGEENYDEFLDETYQHLRDDLKKGVDAAAGRAFIDDTTKNGKRAKSYEQHRRTAVDELFGRLAEKPFEEFSEGERTLWQKIKATVRRLLDKFLGSLKLPKWFELGDNELRYILWRSKERLERGREHPIDLARDIVKREELGLTDEARYNMGDAPETFKARQKRAVEQKGVVMPGLNDAQVKIVNVPAHTYTGTIAEATQQAVDAAKAKYVPNGEPMVLHYDNYGAEFDYSISGKAIEVSLSPKHQAKSVNKRVHLSLAEHIDEVIGNSIEVEEHPDYQKNESGERDTQKVNGGALMHRFYGAVAIDGKLYRVMTLMREEKRSDGMRNGVHAYEVQKIEVLDKTPNTPNGTDGLNSELEASSAVAKLLNNLEKSYDSGKKILDESKKVDESTDLYRDGDEALARDFYERTLSRGAHQFTEAVQDSMLSLKKLYEAILGRGSRIEDVEQWQNAYLAENRMSSQTEAEAHEWHRMFMRPLLEHVYKLTRGKKSALSELNDYLMAKHGLERNEVFAERDARKAEAEGKDYGAAYSECRERDYAGLTALTGTDNVADAELEAQRMVDAYERAHDTDAMWDVVRAVTRSSLRKTYESGLLSKENYERVRDMFEYYVPLQGFDEKTNKDVYAYFGLDGMPTYGTPIKKARGRKSKADDVLATLQMNGEAAIRMGNRNLMKQYFYNFVNTHPSDLVTVNEVWLRKNDATDEWEYFFDAGLTETDSPADVSAKVEAFNERMKSLAASDAEHYRSAREYPDLPYKVVGNNFEGHQIAVKIGGKTLVMTINGNPRAAQALNGLTNPDTKVVNAFGKIMGWGEKMNRMLSGFYVSGGAGLLNGFAAANFVRDFIYTRTMTVAKEGIGYTTTMIKNWYGGANPANLAHLLWLWEHGKLDEGKRVHRYFKEFMENGGETGWTALRDIEGHKRDVARELRRMGNKGLQAARVLGMLVDIANRSAENSARFAAYMTSRERGRSIGRSVWDAKEVSVNFNKKGAGDRFIGANGQTWLGNIGSFIGGLGRGLFVFWNAGVQGLNNVARNTRRHPWKVSLGVFGMNFALGALMPFINALLSGDDGDDEDKDSYYNLPEYVRRSNICIRLGKDMPWITIPLPIEFRAFYGLGELAAGVVMGKERYDAAELAKMIASQLSQVLPLDFMEGGGGWHAVIPSAVKPIVEAMSNTAWTGLPLYREGKYDSEFAPQWTKAYANTNSYLVAATRWLNEATGGSDIEQGWIDWNPAKIDYMLRGYLGGYATFMGNVSNDVDVLLGKKEFDWRYVPVVNRFVKEGDERTEARKAKSEYFDLLKEYEKTSYLLKGYQKIVDSGKEGVLEAADRIAFLNSSPAYARYEVMDAFKPTIDAIRKELKEAEGEERTALEAQEDEMRRTVVGLVHRIDEGEEAAPLIDEALRRQFSHGSDIQRDKAADAIAERMGGKDTYGSPKTEYGERYLLLREYVDLREDTLLQSAQKQAEEAGDEERAKRIAKARRELTTIRKGKHTKTENIAGLGEGNDEEVMQRLRKRRRELMDELGL